ncbi:MAG: penicillin-binding protein 2 [Actinobacteria bacterium]|nr:penicillin-binding protein 2 [Actinomycetota bacterium]MBI3686252.1 penicillin-binding protein 2 [Actinomycetota bacterium]
MNAPVRRVAIAVMVLFGLLIANANYVQVINADALRNDPSNLRPLLSEYQRQRGEIVVDGRAIASSRATDDRLRYLRQYPGGPAYGTLTGFYSLIYGKSGLEQAEAPILSGEDPRLFTSRLTDLFTGRDPRGGSVVLTINAHAQQVAYQSMAGHRGAVVALDPSTGAILAMVSTPSYDPTVLSGHDPKKISAAYQKLITDPASPVLNRAVNQNYPPGSVFKVIVAAAALGTGSYHPETQIPAPDSLPLSTSTPATTTRSLHNFDGESCAGGGPDTLIHALTISCNTAFGQLANTLGEDAIRQQAEAFGLTGEASAVPLPVSASTIGEVPDEPALKLTGIGQMNVKMTPLQGAMIAAVVANRGTLAQPYLVSQVRAPDLTVVGGTTQGDERRVLSSDVADQLGTMMASVVQNGTGTLAQIPGYTVGGKTGTADNAPGKPPHAWFVGYAMQDSAPKVAVAVLIENGGVAGNETTGGRAAAPIARDVMKAVLGIQGGG